MGKRLSTDDFINRSNFIHHNQYDYSLVDYKNNKTKVKIICKEHGIFEQRPLHHLFLKSGCPKCYGNIKSNSLEFISKSNTIHKNKYDYSLVDYKNDKTKVRIICDHHGVFEQTPNVHLKGHGCFKCANKNDLDTFIKKSKIIYGDKYDYSKVEYININTDITLVCKIHGDFVIKPYHFLYEKNGCTYCSSNSYKDISFFEKEANEIHNFKYNYSMIYNLNKKSYITIICPKHGEFKQRIRSHIYDKCGCPLCNESKGEKEISIFLENREVRYIRQFKFDDCKNKNRLPFDFYLPDKNICIEYDGEQHFYPVVYFGGNKRYKSIKNNDSIKSMYCLDNNIRLIRISYKDSISEILKSIFD